MNVCSIALAASAAGYDTSAWTNSDAVISDLVKGVTVEKNGQNMGPFKVDGMTPEAIAALNSSGYIKVSDGAVRYNPDGTASEPIASPSNAAAQSPIRGKTIAAPTPPPSKHPDLDAKMGFRTYKLGTLFSEFNPNDLREGQTFVKSDLRGYFVKSFDNKLGAAEIEAIQLNFVQDILQSVRVHVKGEQSSLALKEVLITAYGQPDQNTNIMSQDLLWIGDDCKVTLSIGISGRTNADFSSKSVNAKIKALTEERPRQERQMARKVYDP